MVYLHKRVFTRCATLWNEAWGRRGFFTFLISRKAERHPSAWVLFRSPALFENHIISLAQRRWSLPRRGAERLIHSRTERDCRTTSHHCWNGFTGFLSCNKFILKCVGLILPGMALLVL